MSNAIYKVVVNNNTIIDVSDTTAVTNNVAIGKTFHLADGSLASGTDDRPSYVSAKKINKSGTYTAEKGTAWSTIIVEIPYQERTVTPTKGKQEILATGEYEALKKVIVNPIPEEYIKPNGTETITQNGTYNVTKYASVVVNVPTSETPEINYYEASDFLADAGGIE